MPLLILLPIMVVALMSYFVFFRFYFLLVGKSYLISLYISIASLLIVICLVFAGFYFDWEVVSSLVIHYLTFLFLLFLISVFFALIFSLPPLKKKKVMHLLCIVGTFLVYVVYGVINANHFVVKEINLESVKINQGVNFILISDSHVGSESPEYFEKIVDKIDTLEKDFVVIAGDLLDSKNIELDDLKSVSKLDVPVYFIIGNHEVLEKRGVDFFTNLGLIVLNNEKATFNDEIDITGINFYDPNGGFASLDVEGLLKDIEIDDSKYNLLLNHEPDQLAPVAKRKIDIQLSGHTHSGQIWPFNYLVKLRYDYVYGLHEVSEDTSIYVSSGVGTWGPNMRTGSKNEIVLFHLEPAGR